MNLRSVARTVENFTDCAAVPKTCVNGQLVAIPKKNGGTLIAANGKTVFSNWTVTALCTGSNQFIIQAAKDPKTTVTLFPEKTLCTAQPAAAKAEEGDLIDVKAGTACLVNSINALPCNPPPPLPPACGNGFVSRGLSLDTFGGNDDTEVTNVFGQRWLRYCSKVH